MINIRTLRIVKQLMTAYLSAALMYRADFFQSVFTSLLWGGFSYVTAFLITSQTPSVFGMNRADLLLLASGYGVVVGIHHWLCTSGFRHMPEVINRGELDGYLLRPFDALTALALRRIAWSSMIRVVISLGLMVILLNHYQIYPSFWQVGGFVVLGLFSFLLIFAVYTLGNTILIWHPYLSNITELVNTITGAARYPLDLQRHTPRMANLIFLPFLLLVNIPVRSLTGRLTVIEGVEYAVFCLLVFVLARWWWSRALRSYAGASG